MIKKILGLFIILFSFISFSDAVVLRPNIAGLVKNGNYTGSVYDSNIEIGVFGNGLLSSKMLSTNKRILAFSSSSNKAYFFWYNGLPYFYITNSYGSYTYTYSKFYLCNTFDYDNTLISCDSEISLISGEDLEDFFSKVKSSDFWAYSVSYDYRSISVCFSSVLYNLSYCFVGGDKVDSNIGLSSNLTFQDFPNDYLGDPPGFDYGGDDSGIISDGGIELESNDSALNYYESRYGWDKKICYVGTDSLNYLYGQSGISFNEGTGLSIFDVYSQLYGSGYELVWVGNWLNTWLLNYEQWFNSRGINAEGVGHPSWLSYYNSGTHLGDLQFDNLTFPFANQSVAFYFMATYIDQNSPYSTMGGPVVSYCNIKINGGSFEDIIDQSDKNNITDYTENHNEHLGLNSDGTERDYGAWLSSGVNVAFSGDVTVKNTLKNFFDQFYNFFNIDIQDTTVRRSSSNPILPGRLVSCLLFVVLFKFIRRK